MVPSLESLLIHPHLLHLTVFADNQKKASYKTPLKSSADWRMVFIVEYGTRIYHIPNYGNQKKVQLPDSCLENKGGQIRVVLGTNKLLINIISSLQGNGKKDEADSEGGAITNLNVIEKRIEEEAWQYPALPNLGRDVAKSLTSKYTNKENKVELHRCRLRACLFDASGNTALATAISDVISNARDKNVGYLDLRSISDPGCCCTKGGWKFFLISEHKLAKEKGASTKQPQDSDEECDRSPPVVPVIVLADIDNNVVDDTNGSLPLNQIPVDPDHFEVHGDAFSIVMPPQNPVVLEMMRSRGLHCRIFLYRALDKKFSSSSVKFVYYNHDTFEDNCPFCLIKRVSQSSLETSFSAGNNPSGKRPRKRAKTSSGSVLSPVDSSSTTLGVMSPYSSDSSGISSPGSSANSPEYTMNDQMSPQYIFPSQNSAETFPGSGSGYFSNEDSYPMEDWSEVDDPTLVNAIQESGLWLPAVGELGSLIFDHSNADLNTIANLPLPDSCQVEDREDVADEKPETKPVQKTEKVEPSKVEKPGLEEALKRLNLEDKPSERSVEKSSVTSSTTTTSWKSDFWLEISVVFLAILFYLISSFAWK